MQPTTTWDPKLYDGKHSFVWQRGEDLLQLLDPRSGELVVDLGCGTGHLTAKIAQAGARVIGIDSSPTMIAESQRLHPELEFREWDARGFQVPEPADAVFSNAVLHWVKPPEAAIARIAAALRTGGRFVAEFGGHGNVRHLMGAMQAGLEACGVGQIQSPWYYPTIGEYARLLEAAGLEPVWAKLFDRPTPLEGDAGLRNWVKMFGQAWLEAVPTESRDRYLEECERMARPNLNRDGGWIADYRRLRIVAIKE